MAATTPARKRAPKASRPAPLATVEEAVTANVVVPDEDGFVLWDDLVTEARIDKPTFKIKVSADDVVEIPCPSGDAYIRMSMAQQMSDPVGILMSLTVGSDKLYSRVRGLMGQADFPIVDNLASKVLRHYFGTDGHETDPGESPAS